ncbi:major facilitator superfamily domain-containing protein [Circinella umbellata]|nr:major facilitator superfamily domain-containing protein [Circinella umbellata]
MDTKEQQRVSILNRSDVEDIKSKLLRSNIGNAKLGGLEDDLHMNHFQYQWSLSIFFAGYILFQLPSNVIMRRWRPSFWLSFLMLSWGIVATAMAACENFAGLMVCRLLLGCFEAGFFPGVVYMLSLWYTRQEYGRRVALFFSFGSLAGAFGGILAYGISQIPTHILATWQWLFIIEGSPSILIAVFSAWYLPDSPEKAKFLTSDEQQLEIERLTEDAGASQDHSFSWPQVVSVFQDWKLYIYIFIYLTGSIMLHGVTLFLPSIVAGMGEWSNAQAQLLTTPPYILAFIATITIGRSSDHFFERGFHMVACDVVAIAGFLLLILIPQEQVAVHYFAACLVVIAVYANVPAKVAWFTNNFGGLTRRAIASAAIVSIGLVGGIFGGQIYYDGPEYRNGNTIACACAAAQLAAILILRFKLARENKRRTQLSEHEKELELLKYGGLQLIGDRHPDFRYVL